MGNRYNDGRTIIQYFGINSFATNYSSFGLRSIYSLTSSDSLLKENLGDVYSIISSHYRKRKEERG